MTDEATNADDAMIDKQMIEDGGIDEGRTDHVKHDATLDGGASSIEDFVASVQHLPLFTGTAMQLIRSVDREDVTAGELGKMIATDAALSAHLLRMVNSPFYGLQRRVGTVTDALAVLGFNLVRRTVTAAVLQRPLFAYLHDTGTARAFWRHELLVAALARHLAMRRGLDGEFAYMTGLLHDVGRLVMLVRYPEHTDLLLRRRGLDEADAERALDSADDSGLERERTRFGFDHAQVGGALLELWGLPEQMIRSAHQHADEIEPDDPAAASVWLANKIAHEMIDDLEEAGDEDSGGDSMGDERPWMQAIDLSAKARRQMLAEIASLEPD